MNLHDLQRSPAKFRSTLRIDADGDPVPLDTVLDPWQRADFQALDPGWALVAGQSKAEATQRAYLERPRGHSKTSDLAVQCCWALFASRRKLRGYGAAADRDQARLLHDAIDKLVRLNPWLGEILEVKQYSVVNKHTGSVLEILSSDAPTSYGLTPDFLIIDELTHWAKRDLWDSLISASAKRARCMVVVITNAGYGDSWQWDTREAVRTDPDWMFSRIDGPQASWISLKRLDEQRRLLPRIAFDRLWLNRWTSGSGDALDPLDIDRALTLNGPLAAPEKGWTYVAGLDLGLSRDKAALAVVGRHVGFIEEAEIPPTLTPAQRAAIEAGVLEAPESEWDVTNVPGTGRLRLAALHVWSPKDSSTGRVSIEAVEHAIYDLDRRFNLRVGCDPWQAAYLVERLRKRDVPTDPVDFTSNNLKSMCSATLEAFAENNVELYPDPQLLSDLRSLRVVEKSYGVRLDSPRGANGHGDAATALAIALHLARTECHFTNPPAVHNLLVY